MKATAIIITPPFPTTYSRAVQLPETVFLICNNDHSEAAVGDTVTVTYDPQDQFASIVGIEPQRSWFESYWWSPRLADQCGAPWDRWCFIASHKTLESAESVCRAAQKKQPFIWYEIRAVSLHTVFEGKRASRAKGRAAFPLAFSTT